MYFEFHSFESETWLCYLVEKLDIRVSKSNRSVPLVGGIERSFQRRCRSISLSVLQRPCVFRFDGVCLCFPLVLITNEKTAVTTEVYGFDSSSFRAENACREFFLVLESKVFAFLRHEISWPQPSTSNLGYKHFKRLPPALDAALRLHGYIPRTLSGGCLSVGQGVHPGVHCVLLRNRVNACLVLLFVSRLRVTVELVYVA